ncbi:MAG: LemA family protein [Firmicutes bacterium]|nr:LemA family protein [Bacillota bacterium]
MRKYSGLLIVLLVAIVIFAGYYNSFISLEEKIEGRWAEIENNLQRRADLIPNLVATVQGYVTHEAAVFTEIAQARSRLLGAEGVAGKVEASSALDSALGRLLMVVEQYPELKADRRFAELQDELAGTENRLSVARLRYNEAVTAFNARIRRFPGNLIAGLMGLERKDYFQIKEEAREVPKVEFK